MSNWSRDETIIAFNVYCKIPFRTSSKNNPTVIKYAKIIGRTPSAFNMKIGNFGRLDPELRRQGIVGLSHGSKLEEQVWNEFNGNWEKLAFESEELIARFQGLKIDEQLDVNFPEGIEKETLVKARVNQAFFRSAILSSYNLRCCITGLPVPDLLVASHIKPWAKFSSDRTNPHNGLCLNSVHDKAFDKGFITVRPDYRILTSKYFDSHASDEAVNELFTKYEGRNISLPDRFLPSKDSLEYHYEEIFQK